MPLGPMVDPEKTWWWVRIEIDERASETWEQQVSLGPFHEEDGVAGEQASETWVFLLALDDDVIWQRVFLALLFVLVVALS